MKGYRTLAFGFATILLGQLGLHVAPELIFQYLDLIFAGLGLGIVILRLITKTPFGQRMEADLGITPAASAEIGNLVAQIDPDSTASLKSAATDFSTAVASLTGHPLFQPSTIDALTNLVNSVQAGSGSTDAEKTDLNPAPEVQAQQAAPQHTLQTSDPAPGASVAPAAAN